MTANGTEKLRVLCLHGYYQNGAMIREKTGSMRKLLKKYAEFEYIDGPYESNIVNPGNGDARDGARGWWFSRPESKFSSKDVTELADGFDESLKIVLDAWNRLGPFDGVLGFSQGASMTHLLLALHQLEKINFPVHFAVLVSGFKSLSSKHADLVEVAIPIPSLHVFGSADEIVFPTTSEKLKEVFTTSTEVVHDGGHFVPTFSKQKADLVDFFQKRFEERRARHA